MDTIVIRFKEGDSIALNRSMLISKVVADRMGLTPGQLITCEQKMHEIMMEQLSHALLVVRSLRDQQLNSN